MTVKPTCSLTCPPAWPHAVFWAARAGRLSSLEILNPDAGMRDDSAAGGGLTLLGE